LWLGFIPPLLSAQEEPFPPSFPGEEEPAPGGGEEYAPLPRSFRDYRLGMALEDLKGALEQDGLFHFRGDPDVSFLPVREENLVETTGSSFVRRAFFQFREGRLFIMAFSLNTALVDHYSVFTSLVKKYGEPGKLDPREAIWESEDTRISLERPLTVKYIDKTTFNGILDESQARDSGAVRLREDFLGGF
jgi:hypothetical protein